MQQPGANRDDPADREPSRPKQVDRAPERMARPNWWSGDRSARLQQERGVGAQSGRDRQDQTEEHGSPANSVARLSQRTVVDISQVTYCWRMRGRVTLFVCALAVLLLAPALARGDGRIVTWTLPSAYVDFSKEPHIPPPPGVSVALHVNVFLPEGYDGRRRFPVLYLFHGHGGRYDSWVDPHGEDL